MLPPALVLARAPLLGVLLLPLIIGSCGAPSGFESPEELSAVGLLLEPAENNRTNEWSYRLDRVEQDENGARVQFVLNNGTARGVSTVMLRVAVRSLQGDYRSVRVPKGAFRPGDRRVVIAHLPPIPFPIDGVAIELLWTSQ